MLTPLKIPEGVTSIGSTAFADCSALTEFVIPNSVTSGIGLFTFHNCTSLRKITIGNSVSKIGELAFSNCSALTEVIIPNSVTLIDESAFSGCSNVTKVVIGDGVTTIKSNAFASCKNLKYLVIGRSVESFESNFYTCDNLETVVSLIPQAYDIKAGCFTKKAYANATLYVPEGTINQYKMAEGWKEFMSIVEGVPTAISAPAANVSDGMEMERYTISGKRISSPQPGVNVVKMSDGTVKKVLVK